MFFAKLFILISLLLQSYWLLYEELITVQFDKNLTEISNLDRWKKVKN